MARQKSAGPKSAKAAAFMRKAVSYFEAGELVKAQKNVAKYLSTDPTNEDANHLAGLVAMNLGQPEQAFRLIKRALDANPRNAMCHSNLGEAYRALQKLPEAEASYLKAIELEPTVGGFYNNLGIALAGQGKTSDAIAAYRTGLERSPRDPMILTNLGNARLDSGDIDGAIEDHERAISLNPSSLEAHANLGLARVARGDMSGALSAFDTVLQRHPHHVQALRSKAEILETLGEFETGRKIREKILQIAPDDQDAYFELADILRLADQPDDAISLLQHCAKKVRNPADTFVEMATIYRATGDKAKAQELLETVLKTDRNHVMARVLLAQITKNDANNDNIEALKRLGEQPELSSDMQTAAQFALGKAMEDIADYEAAAEHFTKANLIRRQGMSYASDNTKHQFAQLTQVFSPTLLTDRQGGGYSDRTPIFIVGMPRSGTSLVEQIIASHSKVRGAGELPFLGQIATRTMSDHDLVYPQDIAKLDDTAFADIGQAYVSMVRRKFGDAPHVTDKLPHNFLQIGLIRLALPQAKIIHCQRHPMDTCLSIFKSTFAETHNYSYEMAELGEYYRAYLKLMEHWRAVLPNVMYNISYEALVEDTENEARGLLAHCELDWEPGCLEFYKTKRAVNTTSASQVRQPIYKSSVALWKRYGEHLRPLIDALGDAVPNED